MPAAPESSLWTSSTTDAVVIASQPLRYENFPALEMQRLLRWLMAEYGQVPALVVSKSVLLALAYFYLADFPYLLAALCAGYAGLAGWNVMQLRKLR